jgi:hypothetical protein
MFTPAIAVSLDRSQKHVVESLARALCMARELEWQTQSIRLEGRR